MHYRSKSESRLIATFLFTALTIGALLFVFACEDNPTAPSVAPVTSSPQATASSTDTPPANPEPPTTSENNQPEGEAATVTATRPQARGERASATFRNNKDHVERVGLCSFGVGYGGDIKTDVQRLKDQAFVEIPPGRTRTLDVWIDCKWQVDAVMGSGKCPEKSRYKDDWAQFELELLEANNGGRKCEPPPPGCNPEALRKKAEAACEYGIDTLDTKKCVFTCKPCPERECDIDFSWDQDSCSCFCDPVKLRNHANNSCEFGVDTIDLEACVFTCKPCPVQKCEEGDIWDPDKCSCVCDPVGLRERANAECEYGVKSLDTKNCSFECKPCEEVNKPFDDRWDIDVSSTHVKAEYYGNNTGSWKLKLMAGYSSQPFKWKKAEDTANTKCGESEKLSISYRHKGHFACLWTIVATGPGLSKEEIVIDRCIF